MKKVELKENGLFYTPKDQKEFEDMMSDFNGAESVAAWTAAGWAWNLAAKMVNEKLAMLDKEELQ